MRIHDLTLKNIGPFLNAQLSFIPPEEETEKVPVTIITGENGTGKSIILDAIRAILTGKVEHRNIHREDFVIEANLKYEGKIEKNKSDEFLKGNNFYHYLKTLQIYFCLSKV